MLTHVVFGAGSVVALLPSLPVDVRFLLAAGASLFVNVVIDELGHTTHGGFVARSPLTHSVFTAPLWGGVVGYLLWMGMSRLDLAAANLEAEFILAGVMVALAHLALDSLTEKGVYFLTGRLAVAHFRSNNMVVNVGFVLVGALLFVY